MISSIILAIIGIFGIWACLWLWRQGWPKDKKYKIIDRETVTRASERNFK